MTGRWPAAVRNAAIGVAMTFACQEAAWLVTLPFFREPRNLLGGVALKDLPVAPALGFWALALFALWASSAAMQLAFRRRSAWAAALTVLVPAGCYLNVLAAGLVISGGWGTPATSLGDVILGAPLYSFILALMDFAGFAGLAGAGVAMARAWRKNWRDKAPRRIPDELIEDTAPDTRDAH